MVLKIKNLFEEIRWKNESEKIDNAEIYTGLIGKLEGVSKGDVILLSSGPSKCQGFETEYEVVGYVTGIKTDKIKISHVNPFCEAFEYPDGHLTPHIWSNMLALGSRGDRVYSLGDFETYKILKKSKKS